MPNMPLSKLYLSHNFSETFLENVKSRRNRVTVNEIIRAYNNNSADRKDKVIAINRIFPPTVYASKWLKGA